ncbi:MAG: hypothetical protein MUC56_09140 [Thermoanaerobaculales bacterium]|jgi:hypothetical protein|nr:hypothetical protein [Thermoanaerobaculales bacterium]
MQDPRQIWELGRWIARRESATARLAWSDGEIVLGLQNGRIHSVHGLDAEDLSARLGCAAAGERELLAEAQRLCSEHGVPETRAIGTVKEMVQRALHGWLTDPGRKFTVEEGSPDETEGPTISITHALVELVLADTRSDLAVAILPDREVLLRRSRSFIELYAPLRLSEEADLIVAGISGAATAASVARASSHHPDEVARLVAALVATGVLEPVEPAIPEQDLDWSGADLDDGPGERSRRKIPLWLIGVAALGLVAVIAVIAWIVSRAGTSDPGPTAGGDWGVVVEMGCEPEDLQRMLRKRNVERSSLRTVKADPGTGDTCFRLVWGSFATRQAAESAMSDVPSSLVEAGFEPHVIEVTEGELEAED